LFSLFNVAKSDLAATLLKRGFTAEQRAAVVAAGRAYRIALPRLTAAEAESKRADGEYAKGRGAARQAKTRLDTAQARHKSKPTAQRSDAVAQARTQHTAAVRAERTVRREASNARKALKQARQAVDDILNEPNPLFANRSLRRRVKARIGQMADDPRFFIDHAQQLQAWAYASAGQSARAAFDKATKQIKQLGILQQTGPNQYVLATVMAGDGPVEHRLSEYERYQIKRFHHVILTQLLYPKILKGRESKNFVDNRLTTPRQRRDVYRYSSEGKLTGWTRYEKGAVKHHRVASPASR
jgi:exonuclease VII small subunit